MSKGRQWEEEMGRGTTGTLLLRGTRRSRRFQGAGLPVLEFNKHNSQEAEAGVSSGFYDVTPSPASTVQSFWSVLGP